MTITVIRRALWAVAVIALGVATAAFWYWWPAELVIGAGVLVILIPVDMALAREERESRHRSPFGPVRKWGRFVEPDLTAAEIQQAFRVKSTYWTAAEPSPHARWWRRMYRRLTAPWWVAAWMPLLLIPAGLWLAPIVHADPTEDIAYISVLDDHGIYYSSEQAAIDTAHAICDAFDVGASFRQVLHAAVLAGMGQMDAANEIGAAIGIYCGGHADVLRPRTVLA